MTRTSILDAAERPPTADDVTRVAVSTVIFSLRPCADGATVVLPLVRRTRDPFEGLWALPGGWLDTAEGLDAAASRTLAETTGLAPSYLEQLYAFGDVDRSPTRVVSIVYWALLRPDEITGADRRRERRVVRRGIPPPPRVRPQRDRRLRAVAPAQQGRLQPHRARPPRRRVHARRAARGVRVDPRPAPGPRELPPPGGELRHPHPDRALPHGQPPAGPPLPLQPGRRARRSRAPDRIEHRNDPAPITLQPAQPTPRSTTRSA